MFCPECGKEIPRQSKFCIECGTNIPEQKNNVVIPTATQERYIPVCNEVDTMQNIPKKKNTALFGIVGVLMCIPLIINIINILIRANEDLNYRNRIFIRVDNTIGTSTPLLEYGFFGMIGYYFRRLAGGGELFFFVLCIIVAIIGISIIIGALIKKAKNK